MKKIFSIALLALLAVGFAGCGGAAPEAAPAKVQNQGQQPDVLKADENGVIAVDKAPVAE
jgi:predicted small lipoprotein YifL